MEIKLLTNGKVKIINNAIDLDKFKFNKSIRIKKREELGISEDTKVIGHIGRFVTTKNHKFLVDIFNDVHEKNKNTMLILVGNGPLEEKIRKKVKKLNLEDNVKFLGIRNDVNELYQAFDLSLLPSLYEGLTVVGVEAQASGLPCILSSEITKENKLLETSEFVSLSESKEKWAEIIIDSINNNEEREDTSEQLKLRNFDIKLESKKLENLYLNY